MILVRPYPDDVSVSPPFLRQSKAEIRMAFRAGSVAAKKTVPREIMSETSSAKGEKVKERLRLIRFIIVRARTFRSSI